MRKLFILALVLVLAQFSWADGMVEEPGSVKNWFRGHAGRRGLRGRYPTNS